MTIIALRGDPLPDGTFQEDSLVIGATREECIEALSQRMAFAHDVGTSQSEDGLAIYILMGGSFV